MSACPSPELSVLPSPGSQLDGHLDGHLDGIDEALDALRRGLPVIVVDDADRENEGDVVMAAVHATPAWVGWTVRHTSGVLCAPMPAERADALGLPPMVERNEDARQTAYTVSVDAAAGVTTGISAADRAKALAVLADPGATAGDLIRPGHVFPLRARPGGVLERDGHTEAAVDLCRLAGLPPVAVIAEVVEDSGETMRLPGLRALADAHGLLLISIADLQAHRRRLEAAPEVTPLPPAQASKATPGDTARVERVERVERAAETALPTRHGTFRAVGYRDLRSGAEHLALVMGTPPAQGALVRVHSECLTGDAFGSARCDCGPQLDAALAAVAAEGGVIVYLRGHEGRGIGLLAKLAAYQLQDSGLDTVAANTVQGLPADAREYGAAAAILADLGLDRVRLLTNNPAKLVGLAAHGVDTDKRVPLQVGATAQNVRYLAAKRDLMGHQLEVPGGATVPSTGTER